MNTTRCKRCGSTRVAWVQSQRTGRWYLALATEYHGAPADGTNKATRGGVAVHAHIAHDCDDPAKGGIPMCERCGTRCGSRMTCDAAIRAAEKNLPVEFERTVLSSGAVRYLLERVDCSIRIYERGGAVELEAYGKDVGSLDAEFATVEQAKAAGLAHVGLSNA